jgi:hypothetical protein
MAFYKRKVFYIFVIILIGTVLFFLGISFAGNSNRIASLSFIANSDRITSLPAPSVKAIPETLGGTVIIQGSGYPESKILIYQDDEFVDEANVDYEGNFSKEVIVIEEGKTRFKVKQVFKGVESPFSEEAITNIDLTPPDPESFMLNSKINSNQTKKFLRLEGSVGVGDKLLINGKSQRVGDDGKFDFVYSLEEGNNTLRFQLMDACNNVGEVVLSKSIFVDTKEPIIEDHPWGCDQTKFTKMPDGYYEDSSEPLTEERVYIGIGEWTGYLDSYNSVPIVGCVSGDVKLITLDGKTIRPDENGEIYQRVRLFIRGGLNKYKVVAIDNLGNKTTSYIETTAQRDSDSIDINLNY